MPRYHIWTIGCQMNKAESERLGSALEQLGYEPSITPESADLVILNSCVVRQGAEDRVINKLYDLRRLKKLRPEVTLALTGCMVNSDVSPLKKRFPHVDYFFGPGETPSWLNLNLDRAPDHPPVSAFVPIIQGCNNFCSYCIVPYRRGRERSRPLVEIEAEVRELVCRGTREVILLGQNVDSYGHDLPDKPDLADLLERLDPVEGLVRLRFLTNHPKDMTQRLIDTMARLGKVCPQVNLPVQSGNNEILKAMKRGYTTEQYRELVSRLRKGVPGIAISTDIIVGFPSETEAQFQDTFNLLNELGFDMVHVAAYSVREGTTAARELEDDVPDGVKKERLKKIEEAQAKIASEINAGLLGKTVEVLVEGKKDGKWQGRTKTDKLVFFSDNGNWQGKLVPIEIDKTSPWSLQGKIWLEN